MKKIILLLLCSLFITSVYGQFGSPLNPVLQKISDMGYDIRNYVELENHYIVEEDLVFSKNIHDYPDNSTRTHYISEGLVSDQNITITVYSYLADEDTEVALNDGTNNTRILDWTLALQQAVQDWNSVRGNNCTPLFEIITDATQGQFADIIVIDQNMAGPISNRIFGYVLGDPFCGNPYPEVWINTDFRYGSNQDILPSQENMRNILAHELGHAIGFWHTDGPAGIPILPGGIGDDSLMHGDIINRSITGLTVSDQQAFDLVYGCTGTLNDNADQTGLVLITDTNSVDFCDNGTFDVSGTFEICDGTSSAEIQLCFEVDGATGTSTCSPLARQWFNNGTFSFTDLTSNIIPNYTPDVNYLVTAKLLGSNPDNSLPHILEMQCNTSFFCNPYPKEYIGVSHKNGVIATDNQNSLIYASASVPGQFALEGTDYPYANFISKYDEDGCLKFMKEIVHISDMKTDNQNNIYISRAYRIEKLSSLGSSLWFYNLPPPNGNGIPTYRILDFDYQNDFLILVENRNTNGVEIHQLDATTGTFKGVTPVATDITIPRGNYAKIVTSKSTNDFYISVNIRSSSIAFGSTTISYDGDDTDIVIMKYQVSNGIVTPTNSYKYIDTNVDSIFRAGNNLFFNRNTDHLFFLSDENIGILDENLVLIDQKSYPFNSFNIERKSNFNESINMLSMVHEQVLYKIEDQAPFDIETVNIDADIVNWFYSSVPNAFNTNHAFTDDNKVYIPGQSINSIDSAVVTKMDANTGDLVNRNAQSVEAIISKEITPKESPLIYPNPFSQTITIEQSDENNISQVIIYDKLGNVILEQKATKNKEISEINTTLLSRGIYFIKTLFKDGTSKVKQLVKD